LRVRLYKYYSIGSLGNNLRVIDRALFKYGFNNFSFEILEYAPHPSCGMSGRTCDKNILLEREQYYLVLLRPSLPPPRYCVGGVGDYNIVELAGNTLGYKHNEESLEKMRNFIIPSILES